MTTDRLPGLCQRENPIHTKGPGQVTRSRPKHNCSVNVASGYFVKDMFKKILVKDMVQYVLHTVCIHTCSKLSAMICWKFN